MFKTMQRESTKQRVVLEAPGSGLRAKDKPDVLQTPGYLHNRGLRCIQLWDGTPVTIQIPTDSDAVAIQAFHEKVSRQSKNDRMISTAEINSAFATSMSEAFDPGQGISMVATRKVGDKNEVMGLGCYTRNKMNFAELSLTIDDDFQGWDIEHRILERLSLLAEKVGIEHLISTVNATDILTLRAFRKIGFTMTATANHGCIIVEKVLWTN